VKEQKPKTHLPIVRPCPLNLGGEVRKVGPHGDEMLVWDEPRREELGKGGGLCGSESALA
jgi:hypothetical protein